MCSWYYCHILAHIHIPTKFWTILHLRQFLLSFAFYLVCIYIYYAKNLVIILSTYDNLVKLYVLFCHLLRFVMPFCLLRIWQHLQSCMRIETFRALHWIISLKNWALSICTLAFIFFYFCMHTCIVKHTYCEFML